jgi:hypothetical protein
MKMDILANTPPIAQAAILPKPFSFTSGGGSGVGGSPIVVQPYMQAVTASGFSSDTPIYGAYTLLCSTPITFLGNRIAEGLASVYTGNFSYAVGAGADFYLRERYQCFITLDGAAPNPPANVLGSYVTDSIFVTPPTAPALLQNTNRTLTLHFAVITAGLAGAHTFDLWIKNESQFVALPPFGLPVTVNADMGNTIGSMFAKEYSSI